MSCSQCQHLIDRPDVPHVIRTCESCGRIMHIHETGKHGRGFNIQKGDQVVIPGNWLNLSFNPLKSTGTFSRSGLQWFAEMIMLEDMPKKQNDLVNELHGIEDRCDDILTNSPLLHGLDIAKEEDVDVIFGKLQDRKDTVEWWALLVELFTGAVKDAIESGEAQRAAWAMACAERCRSMVIYKQHLEEVIWMGHSAKRIVDVLGVWDNNKSNDDEEFWQITFNENAYVISQVFAVPVVFMQDRAYVGGMLVNRNEARFVDYLYSSESSQEAILVEIKTPNTKLLGAKYRGVHTPAAELSGAVVQVLDYRATLIRHVEQIIKGLGQNVSVFNPRCVIIAGNGEQNIDSESKRRSFELFRSGLKDVEIITYDELFRKVEVLGSLFNLIRKRTTDGGSPK